MSKHCLVAAALMTVALAGCDKTVQMAPEPRLVRTITVEHGAEGEIVSLTGHVRPKDQASLAFRLDGRMIERPVHVGDVLKAGQVVAKLDPQIPDNALRSAEANLTSLEATLTQARLTFGRQQQLLKDGWTPRANFDEAQQKLRPQRPRSTPPRRRSGSRGNSRAIRSCSPTRRAQSPQPAPSRARWFAPGRWSCSSHVRMDATPSSTSPSNSSAVAHEIPWLRLPSATTRR